ncbi:MAG TPA: hypothetical protein VNH38_04275 [Candidatus Dormibacteraeota bacterium]|nr:hypothetical protein [Candidatus Dormibacteraeota bacterium]
MTPKLVLVGGGIRASERRPEGPTRRYEIGRDHPTEGALGELIRAHPGDIAIGIATM